LFTRDVKIVVRDSIITDNIASRTKTSSDGGGMMLWGPRTGSLLENVVVSHNKADSRYGEGGGIKVTSGFGLRVVGCTIEGNSAFAGGAGMVVDDPDYGPVVIEDTEFIDNVTPGGVNYSEDGGALAAYVGREGEALRLDRVLMQGNEARSLGAAIYLAKWGSDHSRVHMTNLLLLDNGTTSTGDDGTVVAVDTSYNLDLTLAHVTSARNDAPVFLRSRGAYSGDQLTITLTNTLISGADTAFAAADYQGGVSIRHRNTLAHGVTTMHRTDGGAPVFEALHPVTGDPRLSATGRLLSGSAAIDAGIDAGVAWDIDGQPRPYGGGYDVGADEYTADIVEIRTFLPVIGRGSQGS
jgi:hypothetical protein